MMDYYTRYALVSNVGTDTKQVPVQQVDFQGRLSEALMMFPYGIHANMSVGALVALLNIDGDPGNRMAIGGFTEGRPQMAAGENCIFHPPSGAIVHFKSSGTIEITAKSGQKVVIGDDLEVTGKFGCNGKTPQAPASIVGTPAGTDATIIALIQTALVNNGIGVLS